MKNILILIAFLSFGILNAYAQKEKKWETVTIKTSAVCWMCKDNIEGALAYEKGVKSADLDVESKMVKVKYNPKKTDAGRIRKAIALSGYDADDVPRDPKAFDNLDDCCKKDGCTEEDME